MSSYVYRTCDGNTRVYHADPRPMTIQTITLYADNALQAEDHATLEIAIAYAKEECRWEETVYSEVLINDCQHSFFSTD